MLAQLLISLVETANLWSKYSILFDKNPFKIIIKNLVSDNINFLIRKKHVYGLILKVFT